MFVCVNRRKGIKFETMKKKCRTFIIIGILLALFIMFCIYYLYQRQKNLDNWLGNYYYCETYPHNSGELFYVIEYTVKIYKDGNKYYAQITGDGWQTMTRVLAQVTGDRNKIEIAYLQELSNDMSYRFDEGEVLWRFEWDGNDMNTVWLAGERYFEGEAAKKSFEKVADEAQ